ncbi:MAG: hypothetical protein K2N15_02830 [Lachnospiraceae bacterium]|nr:hypothetical protein [Lachnospiraceae bacterium]
MGNNDLYKNIVSLLSRSDINFRETEIRPIEFQEDGGSKISIGCYEIMNYGPTPLNNTPVISCLIVFALFDAYIENKYKLNPGTSFKSRYSNIQTITNRNIIEKECYRLMKTIRNGFVHNINSIVLSNNIFHFSYTSPQGTKFNLDISSDKLELLYSIILLLVKGKFEIDTEGHFKNIICTYYDELKEYIDLNGNFTDDGDVGTGTANAFSLIPISTYVKFNTVVRYPVENPIFSILQDKIKIERIYNPGIEAYSADYCIDYNGKNYVIPQEVLGIDNSILLADLPVWELK